VPTLRPVIIFLPSLGEADDAHNHWVEVWAKAGYAILDVQALSDDANVWGTPEARSGDFERIARSRFGDELMADRLARLAALLNQIRARGQAGDPTLMGLDWSHLALAGADLGAYTIQTTLNSSPRSLASIAWPLKPLAYIVISPYGRRNSNPARLDAYGNADAGAPVDAGEIPHAPVLMISGPNDADAYGIVTDPSVRRLAFARLGPDRNGTSSDYYLEMQYATHRWLGGLSAGLAGFGEPAPKHSAPPPVLQGQGGVRDHQGQDKDDVSPGGDDDESTPEKKAQREAARAELIRTRSRDLTRLAIGEVRFRAVTVAFLDAYVRGKEEAQTWLNQTAPGWLSDSDRLKRR